MKKITLEVCVDSIESAIAAEKGGATRLELCSNLMIGGTTPTRAFIQLVKERVSIPVYVLIRPRFGDFCYTNLEFEAIKKEGIEAKSLGAHGVVIGILKMDGTLDEERLSILCELAEGMHMTLHRAFDVCSNPVEALEAVKRLGIHTILTSGQKQTCVQGKEFIKELVSRAGEDVEILLGSGLNAENVTELAKFTGARAYHLSGKREKESPMLYRHKELHPLLFYNRKKNCKIINRENLEKKLEIMSNKWEREAT